ncbi:hypothetical protein [Gemmata sp.]|uniref:hypothetical protein n=1 Tax=Gemmata sp. TaxID=1914242 RepID=UPI003F70EEF0
MAPEQLRSMLRATPFRPFKVYMASGHSYPVTSPEWFMVGPITSALGLPGKAGDGEIIHLLENMSITHTEPVDVPPAT